MSIVQVFITAIVTLLLMSETRVVVAQDDKQCSENGSDTPFFGNSCKNIYNNYVESRDKPGYYWILEFDGPSRVYCGMSYTGSSCEDIYDNNDLTTRDKSGYYRINNDEWVYCDMTVIADKFSRGDFISSCAGVGGVWKRIASFNTTVCRR